MKHTMFNIDPWYYRKANGASVAKAALKDLVAELRHYPLMTHSGQTVTFELDGARLRFSIDCKPEKFDGLMAQRMARKVAENVKAAAVKVAAAALREAKSKDYSDYSEEGMKRTFGLE